MVGQASLAATNDILSLRTNFVSGPSLSTNELSSVIKLASICGIQKAVEVRTEWHLGGATIQVSGDEQFEGRSVILKTLLIYPIGSPRVRPVDAPTFGEFWAESARPRQEERTVVKVGDREVRVGLLNGIKAAGADKILDAFVKGRVRFSNQSQKEALSEVDVMQAEWIGIREGRPYITFASLPNRIFFFTLDEDKITVVDELRMFE